MFYNIPLILFVFVLLFPFYWMIITTFRPDGELYRPWNAANYTPFWTNNPTLEHIKYLFEETDVRALDVQHHVHRPGRRPSSRCSAACWRAMRWPGSTSPTPAAWAP